MELTPSVVIIIALVAVVVGVVVIRWGRRHEAAAPVESPRVAAGRSMMAAAGERESGPLVQWLLARASEQTGIPLANDPLAHKRIAEAAAKAMEEMRAHGSASVSLPFLAADARGPKHFEVRVKRKANATFEQD